MAWTHAFKTSLVHRKSLKGSDITKQKCQCWWGRALDGRRERDENAVVLHGGDGAPHERARAHVGV